jgi:hypothetical protein
MKVVKQWSEDGVGDRSEVKCLLVSRSKVALKSQGYIR